MLHHITGIHHITSIASSPADNHAFFTRLLGLRLVKRTVNFDNPQVYHLYYGDGLGTPGTVLTYFPFPNRRRGSNGRGEVQGVAFSVPENALDYWQRRLSQCNIDHHTGTLFGSPFVEFGGPDGEHLRLVASPSDSRTPWNKGSVPNEVAIRGFHSATLSVASLTNSTPLLEFMGYRQMQAEGDQTLFVRPDGNQANRLILKVEPDAAAHRQGAGSVHHIAFCVPDRAAQSDVREKLLEKGYEVTGVRDRNYFWAIYFQTEDGILFEVATEEPGFTADEAENALGDRLKLPPQHEHLRASLESTLPPIDIST